jgi:hypothetical protein
LAFGFGFLTGFLATGFFTGFGFGASFGDGAGAHLFASPVGHDVTAATSALTTSAAFFGTHPS